MSECLSIGHYNSSFFRSKQEKRVSVVPKMTASTTAGAEGAAKDDGKEPENPFGGVKLR